MPSQFKGCNSSTAAATVSGAWHFGHRTVLPASSVGAENWPAQPGHWTLIAIFGSLAALERAYDTGYLIP